MNQYRDIKIMVNVLESFKDFNKSTHRILWVTEYFDGALAGVMLYKNQWAYFNVLSDLEDGQNVLYAVYKLTDRYVHQLVEHQISYVSNYGTRYTVKDYTKGYKSFIYPVYKTLENDLPNIELNKAKQYIGYKMFDPVAEDLPIIGLITLLPTEIFNRN